MRFSFSKRTRLVFAGTLTLAFIQIGERVPCHAENSFEREEVSASCKESQSENKTVEQSDLHELPYKYFGNSYSQKFHRPSCPYGRVISTAHLMPFHFRREAVAAGFAPCHYCLPQEWGSVRCFILPPQEAKEKTKAATKQAMKEEPEQEKYSPCKIDNSTIRLDADGKSL
jgi:hypothetical protein